MYIDDMLSRKRNNKKAKVKLSKSFRSNIAVHPFVIISIVAAVTVVVWVIMSFMFRYL
jgi:hypothetical protein